MWLPLVVKYLFICASVLIPFFDWLKYKKGQPQGLAPTIGSCKRETLKNTNANLIQFGMSRYLEQNNGGRVENVGHGFDLS